MKVTNEKTENSQAFLTIEIEPAELEASLEGAYRRLALRTRIPGFRRGKAPRAILERYLDRESVLEDAINNLVPRAYQQALQEQAIEAFAQPQIEITQTDPPVFKAVVPLKPEIELGVYRSLQIEPEPVAEVIEDNISEVLEQLRHQGATWEPVERPLDFGDLVVLDIESGVDDEPFINQKGIQGQLLREQPFLVPGFAEQLVGMNRQEEKEFTIRLPSDFPREDLAGKEPWFKVGVSEIKQEILPELTDEFAREISADFPTLDSLRERIGTDLRHRAEEKARVDYEEKVIEAVVDPSQIEFPPLLVELEINRVINQRFRGSSRGLEDYLAGIGKTEEEVREELRPAATKRVTRSLVLGKVVEEEKIEVADSEIDAEIESMVKNATENTGQLTKALETPQARESIRQTLFARKAVQCLAAIAGGAPENNVIQKEEA